jgi:uncharacterized membrane protein YfcA
MALFSFSPEFMRPSALVLNIFVSSIALFSYYKNGHFKIKLLLAFVITSIPFAFLGGTISLDPKIYRIILGIFLLIAIARMVYKPRNEKQEIKPVNKIIATIIGAFLGFFSGLIGIGGGIILSPVIILMKWGTIKQTAAVSAAFILLNSISGLIGQLSQGIELAPQIGYMLVAAIIGGFIGSYFGSFKVSDKTLKYALSIVLVLASFKLMFF